MSYSGQKGYQFDLELDLYYCRNRYYDPALGRWLNKDPAQADELNNYRYVGNNPVTKMIPAAWTLRTMCPPYRCRQAITIRRRGIGKRTTTGYLSWWRVAGATDEGRNHVPQAPRWPT